MFSLLSPVSLWLGALLAVPLVIHFLGRQRLRKEPFPSLLLVEERFAKSMQRHRLKNLLLLLVRTLLILCLLLALMNPVLNDTSAKSAARAGGVEAAAALVHNGAYGLVPADADAGDGGPADRDALDRQRRLVRALDSALGIRVQSVPVLADGAGLGEASARRGDYGEAAERLLAALDARAGETRAYLPAFAWEDLLPARQALIEALRERPGLRLVLWDFGEAGARLSAFAAVKVLPSARDPSVTLRASLAPAAAEDGDARLRTWIGDRVVQEARPGDAGGTGGAAAEIVLPLSEGAQTTGRLSLGDATGAARAPAGGPPAGRRFAVEDWFFCFPNPGRLVLAHAGSSLASLPSLGRENYFRRIVHVAAARDLPLGGGSAAGAAAAGAPAAGSPSPGTAAPGGAGAPGSLRLVYLSNERNTDAAAYGRIVEFVKRGGSLIVGVGRESDVPLLNRFLLQPLRMGRLGAVVAAPEGARVEADAQALSRLGGLAAGASGAPGTVRGAPEAVRMRFAFAPDSGTDVLLKQGGEPVLAARRFHQGRVLLWTTDLDDLEWTDLGVSPLVPLLHQAFQEGAGGLTANRAVAPDSLLRLDLAEPGQRAEVRDPEGRPFTRVRAEGGRLRVGPFDKPGLHAAILGTDTVAFAVNPEPVGPARAGDAEDWERWNLDRKAEFLKGFEPFKGRVLVSRPEEGGLLRASVRPLWKWLFLAAILLLFLEGIIASAYSTGSPGRKAA